MVQPFVLVGKAKTVFRLIEIKAKLEQEMKTAMRNIRIEINKADGRGCPFSPDARCAKPENKTCAEIDCEVWLKTISNPDDDSTVY